MKVLHDSDRLKMVLDQCTECHLFIQNDVSVTINNTCKATAVAVHVLLIATYVALTNIAVSKASTLVLLVHVCGYTRSCLYNNCIELYTQPYTDLGQPNQMNMNQRYSCSISNSHIELYSKLLSSVSSHILEQCQKVCKMLHCKM